MSTSIVPAGGTIRFLVWDGQSECPPDIIIDGPREWLRPVVGLLMGDTRDISPYRGTDGHDLGVDCHPLVVDEIGLVYPIHRYLEQVMVDGWHWDHSTCFYQPHVAGPVGDAPRIRVPEKPRVTA